jgi:protein O-GlcNAc transferase
MTRQRPSTPPTRPLDLARAFQEARSFERQGRLREAAQLYQIILRQDRNHFDSLCNLSVVELQQGHFDDAQKLIRRALSLKPNSAEAHNILGFALAGLNLPKEEVAAYERALVLRPDFAEAHYNLGNAFKDQGKLDRAVASYEQALALKPDFVEAHYNLGVALQERGEPDAAAAAYVSALALKPGFAEAHNNLGNALKDRGNAEEAVASYRRALALKPDFADAHFNLGNALKDQGKPDEAAAFYRRALALEPDFAEAHNNLGNALKDQGKLEEAVESYGRALALKPDFAEPHNNLGNALKDRGKPNEAVAAYERALVLKPDYAEAHGNLLLCLNYRSDLSAQEVLAEHRRWDERHGSKLRQATLPHANDRDLDRRLRIGYVSPDYRRHSVAYFLEPLLRAHDRAAVELFCYAEVARPDAVTARLRALADHWRPTVGMSDEALANRIRADRIDILVDLAGHTPHNRLLLFARKPAPVQVTWLGYPNTTGLSAIDFRLVDALTDPEGAADDWASERLIRLEGGFLCYAPPFDAPEVAARPSLASGAITFGSFNNPAKLSAATIGVWAALLARLPRARLLLKGAPFADETTCDLFRARFASHGIDAGRLVLRAWTADTGSHLGSYGEVDVALDAFPYNGTTTTCEALWMGVPVVTLRGDRHAGRVGTSLLSRIGLDELIASDEAHYIDIGAGLAADPVRLAELSHSLRQRLQGSSLCDAAAFARRYEAALRHLWRCRCEGR